MVPFLTICMFQAFAVQKMYHSDLQIRSINTIVQFSAQVGAVIFFAKGFDVKSVRGRVQHVWSVLAVIGCFFLIMEQQGKIVHWTPVTVTVCNWVSTGGFVYYLSYMVYHSDNCELNTAVSFFSLFGKSMLVAQFFFYMNTYGEASEVIFLSFLTLFATSITNTLGLPTNDTKKRAASRGSQYSNV